MFITPAVVGDRVFAGSCSGRFYSFDRHTGEIAWSYDTAQDGHQANFHGDALVLGNNLVVGSDVADFADTLDTPTLGYVYSFDMTSGKVNWKAGTPGGVVSRILHRSGKIYGVSKFGTLLCLSAENGTLLWQADPPPEADGVYLAQDAMLHGEKVVFSTLGGTVVCVEAASGEPVWSSHVEGIINTTLAARGDTLWVGTREQELYSIDLTSGDVLTSRAAGEVPFGSPVLFRDSILLLVGEDTFMRRTLSDGDMRWFYTAEAWSAYKPLIRGDLVWVGSNQGELFGLRLTDGQVAERLWVDGVIRGFVEHEGVFYIGTLGGELFALRP